MHLRKQIRDGIKARLDTVLAGHCTVYSGRTVKFRVGELPAVNVFPSESVITTQGRQVPARIDRQFDLAIGILVSAARDEALDDADAIAALIEPALLMSPEWSLPARSIEFSSDDISQQLGADGEIVALTLRYTVNTAQRDGDPSKSLINAHP